MTALTKYERLEAPGLWRADADAQRREVIVSFGATSLVIADRNEVALAHWSLPALHRRNPGATPALFSPGRDAEETLEIDDIPMVEAIETIRRAVAREGPRRGLIRLLAGVAIVLILATLGWFWLPGALVTYTTSALPPEQRVRLSRALLAEITALTGPPCTTPRGLSTLGTLSRDLVGTDAAALILPQAGPGAVQLPDRTLLIDKTLVEDHEGPGVVAAVILREDLRGDIDDPLARMLTALGTRSTLRLFTTGTLPRDTLRRYAQIVLTDAPDPVPDAALLDRLARAGVPSTPYARAIDPTGETTLALIEADPLAGRPAPPLMSDADWISLQQICED